MRSPAAPDLADSVPQAPAPLSPSRSPQELLALGLNLCKVLSNHRTKAYLSGSLRRGSDTAKDVDIVLVTDDPAILSKAYNPPPTRDPSKEADIFLAMEGTYGAVLAYSTGPRKLNRALRKRAEDMGLHFDFTSDGSEGSPLVKSRFGPYIALYQYFSSEAGETWQRLYTPSEEIFFETLKLPLVPPSHRGWLADQLEQGLL